MGRKAAMSWPTRIVAVWDDSQVWVLGWRWRKGWGGSQECGEEGEPPAFIISIPSLVKAQELRYAEGRLWAKPNKNTKRAICKNMQGS